MDKGMMLAITLIIISIVAVWAAWQSWRSFQQDDLGSVSSEWPHRRT